MKALITAGLLILPIGAQTCSISSESLPAQFNDRPAAFAQLKFKEFYDDADVCLRSDRDADPRLRGR